DVTPKLPNIRIIPAHPQALHEAEENPHTHIHHTNRPDTVVESTTATPSMPAPMMNLDGISFPGINCNCAPPDTNGEVGLSQYVQIVNEGYQVFDKSTGNSVLGPNSIVTVWAGFGGVCQNNGDGDPVVLYDQLADRWVITQFAAAS